MYIIIYSLYNLSNYLLLVWLYFVLFIYNQFTAPNSFNFFWWLKVVNYFRKKLHWMFGKVLNTPLTEFLDILCCSFRVVCSKSELLWNHCVDIEQLTVRWAGNVLTLMEVWEYLQLNNCHFKASLLYKLDKN